MAARRDKRPDNGQQNRRTTFGIAAPASSDGRGSVMSVSARAHSDPDESTTAHGQQGQAIGGVDSEQVERDMFLTPRVLDERAFREFTQQLRALINDAETTARQLTESAEQSTSDRNETAQRSQQLQERLRLSARMLKAIQVQGEALQQSTQRAEQLEQRLQQMNDQAEQRLAELEQRIEAAGAQAMQRIDKATEHAERLLHEADERVSETLPNAERLCHMVETAEVNIAALAHRSAENTNKAQDVGRALASRSQECESKLADADERFDRLEELNQILSRAEVLHQQWSAAVQRIEQTIEPANEPAGSRENAIREVKSSGASVEAIVGELRKSIGEDMARLSQVVHDIATRVDRLQSQRSGQATHATPAVQQTPSDADHIADVQTSHRHHDQQHTH